MFERTKSGQQNRALFYGVSYTCYVEGGGGDDDRSPDASFWSQVLQAFKPGMKIVFLPRGGKPILEKLANDIITKDTKNTLVAMDADYDRIFGHIISDPRVLYSYGYSWECDVFHVQCLKGIIETISHKTHIKQEIINKIESYYTQFANDARRGMKADALALSAGSSVLPRDSPGRVIKPHSGDGSPTIDKRELLKLVKAANIRTRPRNKLPMTAIPNDTRYLVGHCLAHGISILVKTILREIGYRKSISAEHIRDIGILLFKDFISNHTDTFMHSYHYAQAESIP